MAGAVWVALAALACGAAGLAVPRIIARLPHPMGAVARRRGLALRTSLACAVAGGLLAAGLTERGWALLVVLPLVPPAVLLATVDRHTHLLPSRVVWPTLTLAAALIAVAGAASGDGDAVTRALLGGVGVFALFHALWWLHPAGMGYGDVRLSAVVGAVLGYLGWGELATGVYAGFIGFALTALGRAAVRRDRGALRTPAPYGPWLLGGALLGAIAGAPLWSHLAAG